MSSLIFEPPPLDVGHMTPRQYQLDALQALDTHIRTSASNPCVVIPTGGGKSVLMAWAIQEWKRDYPPFRALILAHRKELVKQNSDELIGLWPAGDIGIYSAGLNRKDTDHSILFASIDSIHRKWGEFPPWDVIIVDEAHRIPAKGEGKYRKFIEGCKYSNKNLRVIGFTATPFRMAAGPICHKDHILNNICYDANVMDLINQGYLCKLRSKIGDVQPNLENVKRNSGGDYIVASLSEAVDKDDVVQAALHSAMKIIVAEKRKSVVFFCVDVDHCHKVSFELRKYGLDAPTVTAKTSQYERDSIAQGFKDGRYKAICNVNVFTEGFNAKRIDCIVLLRPTLSRGLFVQMVGRGLRPHPDKTDCLILDYAHCIEEHGPIDCIDPGQVKLIECAECGDTFSKAIGACPNCGWVPPKKVVEAVEREEAEKRLHGKEHSNADILGGQPEVMKIDDVSVHRHIKEGKPDSIRVQYRCGISLFREWICLDHGGYPERKSRSWWWNRFGEEESKTITVDKALSDMFLGAQIRDVTKGITVLREKGKHPEIIGYSLDYAKTGKRESYSNGR